MPVVKRTAAKEAMVIAALSRGIPLTVAAAAVGVDDDTVRAWQVKDKKFADEIAHARELGWDHLAKEALEIADTPVEGVETIVKPDGSIEERKGDMLGHRKLQIETRLKLLAKWDPKRYGDRQHVEHSGQVGLEHWVLDAMGKRDG